MSHVRCRPCGGTIAVVVAFSLLLVASRSALASEGRLFVRVTVADNVLAGTPARTSLVTANGELLDYAEELLARAPNLQAFQLVAPAGTYDVRVEGEGLVTEVKRGVPIFAGRDEYVSIVAKPGEGLHVVEYAVACLSREEVAARLAQLAAETSELRAELAKLRSSP